MHLSIFDLSLTYPFAFYVLFNIPPPVWAAVQKFNRQNLFVILIVVLAVLILIVVILIVVLAVVFLIVVLVVLVVKHNYLLITLRYFIIHRELQDNYLQNAYVLLRKQIFFL